jgi:hypothetical protein
MSAFSVGNGGANRRIYDPALLEYRAGSNEWVAIASSAVVNRVGVVAPGQAYVFFAPGALTNGSLRIRMVCREKADARGLLTKVEGLVRDTSRGKVDAWLGKQHKGILTERVP